MVGALTVANLSFSDFNPRQINDSARAIDKIVKTDALDARVLGYFAKAIHPIPHPYKRLANMSRVLFSR